MEEIKTPILCSVIFSPGNRAVYDNVEEYCTARRATGDNIIRRMRFKCCITKAINVHSEYVILFFHGQSGYANAPQCYIYNTLPVLLDDTNR